MKKSLLRKKEGGQFPGIEGRKEIHEHSRRRYETFKI